MRILCDVWRGHTVAIMAGVSMKLYSRATPWRWPATSVHVTLTSDRSCLEYQKSAVSSSLTSASLGGCSLHSSSLRWKRLMGR